MTRVGVVDVGTNSVRVLVCDVEQGRIETEQARDLTITRLGEGVDATRRLGAAALQRTVRAIAAYHERCRDLGAASVTIAATSAVRDAANADEFLRAVRAATGCDAVALSGDQEAKLGFQGATAGLSGGAPFLVCDIGGGSTELVLGSERAERWVSLDIGSVRLSERHVRTDPPSVTSIGAVARDADEALRSAGVVVMPGVARTLVGLAGTITTVAAVVLGLEGYVRDRIHHTSLSLGEVEAVEKQLCAMTSTERLALPAMPHGREDVIVAGVVILERVMRMFEFSHCLVSECDILDGIALSVAGPGEDRALHKS